ncbi:hypothetical protein BHE74_00011199 [Ensete ventricosum]|nr:hypothetical protein BHE74_00011199 [Ensete ventricosum]
MIELEGPINWYQSSDPRRSYYDSAVAPLVIVVAPPYLLPSAVAVLPHASRRHLCRRLASPQPLPSSFPPFLPQQPHTLCAVFPFSSLIYRWHFCCCLISPPSSVAAFAAAPSPFASAASAPPAALGRTHPHGHHLFLAFPLLPCSSPVVAATRRRLLPAILPCCRCFPAASSALLLPPTLSSLSVHNGAASASCYRNASVPLFATATPICRQQPHSVGAHPCFIHTVTVTLASTAVAPILSSSLPLPQPSSDCRYPLPSSSTIAAATPSSAAAPPAHNHLLPPLPRRHLPLAAASSSLIAAVFFSPIAALAGLSLPSSFLPCCRSPHPCHRCFLSLGCFFLRWPPEFLPSSSSPPAIPAISHCSRCNPLPQPPSHSRLQPSVAHTHMVTTSSLLFPFFPAPHLSPLPHVVSRCRLFFPAASSALLLLPTPSSPSMHSSAASASYYRSASVPLSLLPPPPCCRSRLQPCPPHLLPFAATSVANTPRRTPLLVGLPLLLPRRTLLLAETRCPSLLSASPQPLPLPYVANSCL